jgi:glutathione S-transferase
VSALALLIGNKNYSSWSLRPWFALRQSGLAFDEERVAMNTPEFAERVRAWSPAGRVPVLRHGSLVIWDSLAICEYLADAFPETHLWPGDSGERAHARAISSEMHSGFQALRSQMPMNVRARNRKVPGTPELAADVARIGEIWRGCRERARARGPFLFGAFSIADAMFGPVAFRFATYGVPLGPAEGEYAETLRSTPALRAWAEDAARETEVIPAGEVGT